ncbi:uncharacterized protein LOC143558366 isoform X2 [Bidens hawaiensis]|uniref:uncharacterized protein LOC143558366 isoform X2 n=1 Tax=Bidens hawaiensis TaxID=980011 RepID=UPI004049CF2F
METLKGSDTLIEGLFDFDPCKVNRVDSSSHVTEVPIKGISLFVELKGGVASKLDVESVRDVNVNVDVKNSLLHENKVKFNVDVGQQESEVNVGDLVWAIIKRQKWWPGIICDTANAANVAANRPTREDDVLVKFFGNGKFVWCSPYEVRPFVGYFDQIPNQSTAKKFHLAFEKAVTVFGYRVKREFTCSCLSSFNMKADKRCNLGDYSVARFEPAAFLEHIKDLAKDISRGQKTDNVAKHNCLSAFYRSLGHLQIPMHQLKPANGSPSKIKTENENGYFIDDFDKLNETRERRKSSFLSYPGEFGIDESNVDVMEGVGLSQTGGQSQPVKKPRKKWTRKKKVVEVNICSSDVLSQLRFAAQDCFYPCESKNFDLVQRFVSGFRKVAFKDSTGEIPVDVLNHQDLQETLPKKAKKDKTVISPAFGNGFSSEIPVGMVNHQILQETLPKKARKKKEKFILPAFGNNLYHDPRFMNFQNVGPHNLQAQSMENKKTEWQTNQANILNYGHVPPPHPPPCKLEPIRPKNVADNVTSMPTWNADIRTPPPNVHHMEGLYQAPMYFTNQFGSSPPYFTGNLGQPQTGLGQNGLTRVPKKRGRKRKNVDLQANPGSALNPQAYPGSTMNPQAYPSSALNPQTYPGSALNPQAYRGSALNPQAYPGSALNPQAYPGSAMNPQAYPGSAMNPQAYPGLPMNPQGHPGLSMNPQAYPGSTMNPQAYPGSTMNPQAYPGSVMNPQAYPGSTMIPQANPGSTMNPQANPGSTMNPQANPGSNVVPNPNENVTGQKKQKREKKSKEIGVKCIDLSYNKVQQDDSDVKGTAFLLKFSSEYPLPTNQDLHSVFSKFGALIESETQVSNENLSGQVVFLDSSSAGGAFWGLQNEKPFGPVLVNYKIQHLAGSESLVPFKTPIKSPSGPKPIDPKAVIGPTMMPDLNSNSNSSEVQIIKRSQTIEEIRLPSNDNYLSYTKVQQGNEPVSGTALILKFSPNYPLPSSQDLNLVFCKYGELNELETRVCVQNFTGQVVFVNPSVAGDAINKFQKDQPFGPALLSYRVDHLYNVQSAVQVKSPVNKDVGVVQPAVQVVKSAVSKDFGVIKKNLEMMNMMLEKSGESLSPEMRGKLESEIKGLMKKLSVMDGSSSASSSCL